MDPLAVDPFEEVLRRLPLRSLAACRCVCKAWRAAVDGNGILAARAPMLPRSLTGIFLNFCGLFKHHPVHFLDCGSTSPRVDRAIKLLPGVHYTKMDDHCNGLCLVSSRLLGETELYVCNPATRRWAPLPPCPQELMRSVAGCYLAFDPAASLHYDVILFPKPRNNNHHDDVEDLTRSAVGLSHGAPVDWPSIEFLISLIYPDSPLVSPEHTKNPNEEYQQRRLKWHKRQQDQDALIEWPASLFRMHVFSSRTSQWEEREFIREGDTVVTLADVMSDSSEPWPHSSPFCPQRRNALYWRAALYVHCRGDFLTKLSFSDNKYQVIKMPTSDRMERYEKSCLGRSEKGVYYATLDVCELRVWTLDETSGPMEWTLKYHVDLEPFASGSHMEYPITYDSGDLVDLEGCNIFILGFHPFKEVIFLCIWRTAMAFHFRDFRAECLGGLLTFTQPVLNESFPYTPCLIDSLPTNDN